MDKSQIQKFTRYEINYILNNFDVTNYLDQKTIISILKYWPKYIESETFSIDIK